MAGETGQAESPLPLLAELEHALAVHAGAVSILHISAVVAVLCFAYVGFDRASGELPSRHTLDGAIQVAMTNAVFAALPDTLAMKEVLRAMAKRVGIRGWVFALDEEQTRRVRYLLRYHLLRFVYGERDTQTLVERLACHCYQQWHFPCLKMFRSGWNVRIGVVLATASMMAFFVVAYLVIDESPLWRQTAFVVTLFVVYALTTAAILVLGLFRMRLQPDRLIRVCSGAAEFLKDNTGPIRESIATSVKEMQETLDALDAAYGVPPATGDVTEDCGERVKPPRDT